MNNEQTAKIYGVLFSDSDGNGLYSPKEEEKCIQQTVTAYNNEMIEIQRAVTDNAGHFSMKLPANQQYHFVAKEVQVRQNFFITSDQFVPLPYTPAAP